MTLVIVAASSSGNDLQIAWLALAAVLLGALITGGFSLWNAWSKERADASAERGRHEVEVRRAARLIDVDLRTAETAARIGVEDKEWWHTVRPLTSTGWEQYRSVIASELSEGAWTSVSVAFMAIDHLQWARDAADKAHRAKMAVDPATADMVKAGIAHDLDVFGIPPMSDGQPALLEPMLRHVERGRAALAPLTRDKAST